MSPFEIITTIIQTVSFVAFVVYVFLTYRLWKATLAGNQPELQILWSVDDGLRASDLEKQFLNTQENAHWKDLVSRNYDVRMPVEDFPPQFLVLRLKNVGTAHITGVSLTIQYTIEDLKNILQPTFYEQSLSLTEGIAPGAERHLWVFEITHLPAVYYEITNLTFFDHTGRVRYDYIGQTGDELINNLLEIETNG